MMRRCWILTPALLTLLLALLLTLLGCTYGPPVEPDRPADALMSDLERDRDWRALDVRHDRGLIMDRAGPVCPNAIP